MKKNNITGKLVLLLLAVVFAFTAVACSNNGDKPGKNTGNVSGDASGSTSDTDAVTEAPYPLEIVDYKGRDFRVALFSTTDTVEFFVMDGESGDSLDAALYKRNSIVESRYNVTIEPVFTNGEGLFGHTNIIADSILGDEDAYDLITSFSFAAGPLIMNCTLLDWNQQKYTDLEASYWTKSINDKFEIDGHIYTAVGDTNIYALMYTQAMMFNRTAGDNEKITDDVFKAIKNGTWTIDYFNSLVANIYKDIDGDPGRTAGDYYGFQGECLTNLDAYQFAFDIPMTDNKNAGDAGIEFVFNGEKLHNAVDKVIKLYWNTEGSYVEGDNVGAFVNGNAVFSTILINDCFTTFRNMRDHYTILPMPKYDENQTEYLTGIMDNYKVIGIPISVRDADFCSLITEALNYEAERILWPAYYEDALQTKYKNDEETVEMLDILMNGRTADFGTLCQNNLDNISVWFRWIVASGENTAASYVAEREAMVKMYLEAIVNKYREAALG